MEDFDRRVSANDRSVLHFIDAAIDRHRCRSHTAGASYRPPTVAEGYARWRGPATWSADFFVQTVTAHFSDYLQSRLNKRTRSRSSISVASGGVHTAGGGQGQRAGLIIR